MPYGLKGSYSVGGGKTKHVGSGSMKRPTTTTTSARPSTTTTAPRSSYQAPSKIKSSSGVAQYKTTPIKGTPKVPTTTTTKPRALIKDVEKARSAAQSRQSMLDEIMKGL